MHQREKDRSRVAAAAAATHTTAAYIYNVHTLCSSDICTLWTKWRMACILRSKGISVSCKTRRAHMPHMYYTANFFKANLYKKPRARRRRKKSVTTLHLSILYNIYFFSFLCISWQLKKKKNHGHTVGNLPPFFTCSSFFFLHWIWVNCNNLQQPCEVLYA